ncbi:hypothetical protein ALP05_05895 [Pseudomonas caricapapayae]|uniref:Uncharacterized protein n=1 Tax=Pseudomonas caricapapayae TaxID=46678 RepID=A0A3M6FF66_9PSED|nr:hypothetical protein ALP05_05895 [Pseudomonas caricapapayae]
MSAICRFCRSGLVRELPGTGSQTRHLGAPDTIRVTCFGAKAALRLSTICRFCRSGLVRELPGTGSKTRHLGAPDTTRVACFGAEAALRLSTICRFCRSGLVRELPGTGSQTRHLGAPDTTRVACFGAASQPFADKSAPTPSGPKQPFACPRYPSFVGADSSANCREPAAKPDASVHQIQPKWPVLGPKQPFACPRYLGFVGADSSANCREPAAKPGTSVHQMQPRWPVLGPLCSLRGQVRSHALRAEAALRLSTISRFCRSGLVRELPGTGSQTRHLSASDTTKVACFGAEAALRLSAISSFCRSGLVRELPGTGSKAVISAPVYDALA